MLLPLLVTAAFAIVGVTSQPGLLASSPDAAAPSQSTQNSQSPQLPQGADSLRVSREGFGIILHSSDGSRVDTFRGIVTKDLGKRDTTISLAVTNEELDTLYARVLTLRIFELPQEDMFKAMSLISDMRHYRFVEVRAGNVSSSFFWDGRPPSSEKLDEWIRVNDLVGALWAVVQRRPEYRALPSAPSEPSHNVVPSNKPVKPPARRG